LRRAAGLIVSDVGPEEEYFSRRFSALLHSNDPAQIAVMANLNTLPLDELDHSASDAHRLQMLAYQVDGTASRIGTGRSFAKRVKADPYIAAEIAELAQVLEGNALPQPVPLPGLAWSSLCLHGQYRLNEILTAVGFLTAERRPLLNTGVLRLNERKV
jgi:hypothetical protein